MGKECQELGAEEGQAMAMPKANSSMQYSSCNSGQIRPSKHTETTDRMMKRLKRKDISPATALNNPSLQYRDFLAIAMHCGADKIICEGSKLQLERGNDEHVESFQDPQNMFYTWSGVHLSYIQLLGQL